METKELSTSTTELERQGVEFSESPHRFSPRLDSPGECELCDYDHAPEPDSLLQAARMALQQFEFQYGARKRGWDAVFLMDRLRAAISKAEVLASAVSGDNNGTAEGSLLHQTESRELKSLRELNKQLKSALEGLSLRRSATDKTHCWCNSWDWTRHNANCGKARAVLKKAEESK